MVRFLCIFICILCVFYLYFVCIFICILCLRPFTGELTAQGICVHFNLYLCVFSICICLYLCLCILCARPCTGQLAAQRIDPCRFASPVSQPTLVVFVFVFSFVFDPFYPYIFLLLSAALDKNSQTDLYPCLSSVPAHPCCICLCICFCI